MAEPALPQKPDTTQRLQNEGAKRDNAQIHLPAQTPAMPPRRSPPTALVGAGPRPESPKALFRPPLFSPRPTVPPALHPLSKPTAGPPVPFKAEAHRLPRAPAPEGFGDVPIAPSPKKETARITILPQPSTSPDIVRPAPGAVATSRASEGFDSIPRWFCWGLLGLSGLIFLIQIWNYALS